MALESILHWVAPDLKVEKFDETVVAVDAVVVGEAVVVAADFLAEEAQVQVRV